MDLFEDPRFRRVADRSDNQVVLAGLLEEEFAKFSVADMLSPCIERGVPCAPINDYEPGNERENSDSIAALPASLR